MEKTAKTKESNPAILQPEVVEETPTTDTETANTETLATEPVAEVAPQVKNDDVWGKYAPPVDGGARSKPSKGLMWVVIILVAATVAVVGLVVKSFMGSNDEIRTVVSDQTATPTPDQPSPTPSPTPEITDKADVKIQVLNGSGVTGQAGQVATALEEAGFEDVATGNGDDNTGATQVAYSSKVDNKFVEEVVTALEETFDQVDSAVDEDLGDYHIVVTTGSGDSSDSE